MEKKIQEMIVYKNIQNNVGPQKVLPFIQKNEVKKKSFVTGWG